MMFHFRNKYMAFIVTKYPVIMSRYLPISKTICPVNIGHLSFICYRYQMDL